LINMFRFPVSVRSSARTVCLEAGFGAPGRLSGIRL
jgi:hypothetical protein